MKKWNWRLILIVLVFVIFVAGFLLFSYVANAPVFEPFQIAGYEPSAECIFGIVITTRFVFFVLSVMAMWELLDYLFKVRKLKKMEDL